MSLQVLIRALEIIVEKLEEGNLENVKSGSEDEGRCKKKDDKSDPRGPGSRDNHHAGGYRVSRGSGHLNMIDGGYQDGGSSSISESEPGCTGGSSQPSQNSHGGAQVQTMEEGCGIKSALLQLVDILKACKGRKTA